MMTYDVGEIYGLRVSVHGEFGQNNKEIARIVSLIKKELGPLTKFIFYDRLNDSENGPIIR